MRSLVLYAIANPELVLKTEIERDQETIQVM